MNLQHLKTPFLVAEMDRKSCQSHRSDDIRQAPTCCSSFLIPPCSGHPKKTRARRNRATAEGINFLTKLFQKQWRDVASNETRYCSSWPCARKAWGLKINDDSCVPPSSQKSFLMATCQKFPQSRQCMSWGVRKLGRGNIPCIHKSGKV